MDFNLPCRTSPRWCSWSSPGDWFGNLSKCYLKINTKGRFKEEKEKYNFKFDFDLPCRTTSPKLCSRGSPGGWSWISFELKYDNWFIKGGDI